MLDQTYTRSTHVSNFTSIKLSHWRACIHQRFTASCFCLACSCLSWGTCCHLSFAFAREFVAQDKMFLVWLDLVGSSYLSPVVVALEFVARVNVVWLKLVLWLSCLNHVFGDKLHFVWQFDPGSFPGLSQSHTPLSAVLAPCLQLVCALFAPGLWRFILSEPRDGRISTLKPDTGSAMSVA